TTYGRERGEVGAMVEARLELERLEALLHQLRGFVRHDLRARHVDRETELHAVAQFAAEQLIDRQAQDASGKIVQRDVDTGLRRIAVAAERTVHGNAKLVQRERVLADEQRREQAIDVVRLGNSAAVPHGRDLADAALS